MGTTAIDGIRTSSDTASGSDLELAAPSSGRTDSRWIQASIARDGFATIKPVIEIVGCYARQPLPSESGTVRSEIADLRFAAAASFFAFEDSLPANEAGPAAAR